MKIAAAAAGGCNKAVDIMENYYVESMMLKPGEIHLSHKADEYHIETMFKADYCTMCWA